MTQNKPSRPSGMFGLTIVLAGQAISILASGMTDFDESDYFSIQGDQDAFIISI